MSDESQQKSVFVDEGTQKRLNEPVKDPSGVNDEESDFLKMIVSYVKEGKIDLYRPETLINQKVYSKLSQEEQGKVDIDAVNLLSIVRDIQGLFENGYEESFQIQNLVERLKLTKERLEDEGGDLFII